MFVSPLDIHLFELNLNEELKIVWAAAPMRHQNIDFKLACEASWRDTLAIPWH